MKVSSHAAIGARPSSYSKAPAVPGLLLEEFCAEYRWVLHQLDAVEHVLCIPFSHQRQKTTGTCPGLLNQHSSVMQTSRRGASSAATASSFGRRMTRHICRMRSALRLLSLGSSIIQMPRHAPSPQSRRSAHRIPKLIPSAYPGALRHC